MELILLIATCLFLWGIKSAVDMMLRSYQEPKIKQHLRECTDPHCADLAHEWLAAHKRETEGIEK